MAQAFGNLVRQLLTESRENLQTWRKKLLSALGGSGAVIIEVIPEVEFIIGPQPPVEALQPQQAQNRFQWVFRNFIRVFAQKKHPLAFFMDDLQWSDPASLQLIRCLSDCRDGDCLLFIGAYRDNEVTEAHALTKTLAEIRRTEMQIRNIPVKPLDLDDTSHYITGVLPGAEETAPALAKMLFRKTAGTPLFLKQLLQEVHDKKLIAFNPEAGYWQWDPASLEKLKIPDDLPRLLTGKLEALPEKTREVLKVAACIGNTFGIEILSLACGMTAGQTVAGLQPAALEGLVLPGDDVDRTAQNLDSGDYEFLHDCVRQATYSLLSEQQKKRLHLALGRLMLENTPGEKLDEKIPSIMAQLNRGRELLEGTAERIKFARYNLTAGRKAKDAAAYDSALGYLKAGADLLPENSWAEYYRLTYELYLERSQCEYLCGRLDEAERLFDLILGRARTELEKAHVYGLKMTLHSGTGRNLEAVKEGLTALKQLGFNLPVRPGKMAVFKEMLLIKWRLRGKKIKDLQYLPEMNRPVQKKALELMALLAPAANSISPELFALLCLKAGNLSITYGNSDLSSIGYAGYAIILSKALGDCVTGRQFGELAVQLAEKYNNRSTKSMVYFIVGALVSHWTQHGKTGVEYLQKAVECGLETGMLTYISYALNCIIENKTILGDDFDDVYREYRSWYHFAPADESGLFAGGNNHIPAASFKTARQR